jgi:surface antigen
MSSNHQYKRKRTYWLQSRIRLIFYNPVSPGTPVEQIPFSTNMSPFQADYMHTPSLNSETYKNLPPHFYAWQSPDTTQYAQPVRDPMYDVQLGSQNNGLLPPHPPLEEWQIKDVSFYSNPQRIFPRPINSIPEVIAPMRMHKRVVYSLLSRRFVVHGALSVLLVFIAAGVFMTMVPLDKHERLNDGLPLTFHSVSVRKNETALIAAQVATATAVTIDGYDPGGGHTYAGVLTRPDAARVSAADYGSLNHFFYGQCTYWVNMRYHQTTGHWIPWLGNAYQWAYRAPAYGWTLSTAPNPHGSSIIVFSPYAEGAGAYGHVAVVEGVNSDGSVLTSNWNWGGDWATLTYRTFYPGPGVRFIWYPN